MLKNLKSGRDGRYAPCPFELKGMHQVGTWNSGPGRAPNGRTGSNTPCPSKKVCEPLPCKHKVKLPHFYVTEISLHFDIFGSLDYSWGK